MRIDGKKLLLTRMLVGGIIGMIALYFAGGVLNGLGDQALPLSNLAVFEPVSPRLTGLVKWKPLAMLIQLLLYFALGVGAGVATLPFADSGRELVVRSLAHFGCIAGVFSLLVWLCRWNWGMWEAWLAELGILAAIYVLIWLGRWVGWYAEVAAIREKLGLAPGPSLFHWKETLPYVGFAFLICLAIPTVVRLCDDHIPLFSILYGVLLLPVVGFMSGLSLGRRHGFCPLYSIACAVFIVVFILTAKLYTNMADGILIPIAAVSSLAGSAAGAVRHKIKGRNGGREEREGVR